MEEMEEMEEMEMYELEQWEIDDIVTMLQIQEEEMLQEEMERRFGKYEPVYSLEYCLASMGIGEYASEQVNNVVDNNDSIINNFDSIANTSQFESYLELEEQIIKEETYNSEQGTTYLVSTSSVDLDQHQCSHIGIITYTIGHINYERNNTGTLPFKVDTIPVIDSVPVTAYSSQFKIWDPGLRAA